MQWFLPESKIFGKGYRSPAPPPPTPMTALTETTFLQLYCECEKLFVRSDVGAGAALSANATQNIWIVKHLCKNLKKIGQRSFVFFNNINEMILLCYLVHKWKFIMS